MASIGRLIGDPREAFLAAENGQHLEDAGRGGAPGQRRAQRLGDLAELQPFRLGEALDRGFGASRPSSPRRPPSAGRSAGEELRAPRRRAAPPPPRRGASGRSATRNAAPVDQIDQRLGALLEAAACAAREPGQTRCVEPRRRSRRRRQDGAARRSASPGASASLCAQIVGVEALELGEVEARGAAVDRRRGRTRRSSASVDMISSSPCDQPRRTR